MSADPILSIRIITYNHEKYIARCLESVLMQRTSFPFEVIVGEDCSSDHTRQIVLAYQEKYPDQVRVITSEKNVGAAQNSLRVQQACRGKYHAFCEGDDYWIDPLKLQKQVDFMETHTWCSLCFHNLFIVNETHFGAKLFYTTPVQKILNFAEAVQIPTQMASVLARSEILASLPPWRTQIWCSDALLRLWCAHNGKLGYLDETMAVYRVHNNGATHQLNSAREKYFSEELWMYEQLDQETGFQHSEILHAQIKLVHDKYQRDTLGKLYYLLHPHKIIARFYDYRSESRRYRTVKWFGRTE